MSGESHRVSVEGRKPLVAFHANCVDGFTAAWCAHSKFGDNAEYVGMKNDGVDFDVDNRDVFFLDCSPRRAQLLDFKKQAKNLVVLDHHISNEKECEGIEGCTLDMNKSGAMLAAEFFSTPENRFFNSRLVQYVQDQDLWKFELENSKLIRHVIIAENFDMKAWTELYQLLETRFETAVEAGSILGKAQQKNNAYMAKKAVPMLFRGYDEVPVLNMAFGDISQVLNDLSVTSRHGFAVAWHLDAPQRFKYSIRSQGGRFDCAAFAEREFGGAGHQGAAGWIAPCPPWEYRHPRIAELP